MAAVLLKVQLPPGLGGSLGSKTMKFAEDMSVSAAVADICRTFKIPEAAKYYIFRPAKLGWLGSQSSLKSYTFEPQESVLLMSRFQTIVVSRPAFASAFAPLPGAASSSSSSVSAPQVSAVAKKRKNLVLLDFARPLKSLIPFLLRKLTVKGNPQHYALRWKERDLLLNGDKSLFEQNVDPNYCTIILEDAGPGAVSSSTSSSSVDADPFKLDLTAPLSRLLGIVKMGPLITANHKKKWERRWCALSDGHLFYYTSMDAPSPAAVVPLRGYQLRSQLDLKKKNFVFELFQDAQHQSNAKHSTPSNYFIKANDEMSFNEWVGLLEEATGKAMIRPGEETAAATSAATGPKKVFGGKLEDACDPGKLVPYVVLDCIKYLEQHAMKIEGVFRLSGGAQAIKQYAAAYDRGERANFDNEQDPHNVSGVLKQYFRDMEEPILTYDFYTDWLAADAAGKWDNSLKLGYLRQLINDLPLRNRETLAYLFGFLVKIASFSSVNQMGFQNLATVFGPNMLKVKGGNMLALVSSTAFINSITHSFLEHYSVIFGDAPQPPVGPFNDNDHEAPPGATPIYEFPGSNPYELPLKTGDLIYVFHQSPDGWWRGECCGRYGRFPGQYVKNLSTVAMARLLKKQTYERKMNVLSEAEQAEQEKIEDLKLRIAQAQTHLSTLQERAAATAVQAQEAKDFARQGIAQLHLEGFVTVFLGHLEKAQRDSTEAAALEEIIATEIGTLHKALLSLPPVDPKKKKTGKQDQSHIDLVKEALSQIQSRVQTEQQTRRQAQEHRKYLIGLLQGLVPVVQNIQGGSAASSEDLAAVFARERSLHASLFVDSDGSTTPRSPRGDGSLGVPASSSASSSEPLSPRSAKSAKKHAKKLSGKSKKDKAPKEKTKKK